MSPSDLGELERLLLDRHAAPWVRHHLASFTADYFAAFRPGEIDQHVAAMSRLSAEAPVVCEIEPLGPNKWRVTVVGYDAFQLLSTVCMVMAVRGLAIEEGLVFTSNPPFEPAAAGAGARGRAGDVARSAPARTLATSVVARPDSRKKVVDVFTARLESADGAAPDWESLRTELRDLVRLLRDSRFEEVRHRLIERFVAALAERDAPCDGLEPLDLAIDPEHSNSATVVDVGARDSFGFLSLTAGALALCGIMIERAVIRTRDGRVEDRFWVTDRGGRRIETEARLRELRLSLILIEHFSRRLPLASNPEAALLHFGRFATETMARPDWAREFAALDQRDVLDALVRVLGESQFLWDDFLQVQPETVLPIIGDPAAWRERRPPAEMAAELERKLAAADSFESRGRVLRRFRDRELFRADVRSILGLCGGLEGFSDELTEVAETILRAAWGIAAEQLGMRDSRAGGGAAALFALGKCGGRELGFGSDLELLLVYDDRGLDDQAAALACSSFERVVSALRRLLSARRGGMFEPDFRLRPHGESGPAAVAWSAFHAYYSSVGPAWPHERQALIKLRPIAGDNAFAAGVVRARDEFVYTGASSRAGRLDRVRQMQVDQLVAPDTIHAKHSPGALVDIEYCVQSLQIERGANDQTVRTTNTLAALAALEARGHVTRETAERLRAGYRFFRELIDALRVVRGYSHDLTVPKPETPQFRWLARRLRSGGPESLQSRIDHQLNMNQAAVASVAGRDP